jgi:hypothetical protein
MKLNLNTACSPTVEGDSVYLDVDRGYAVIQKEGDDTPIVAISLVGEDEHFTASRTVLYQGYMITVTRFCIWVTIPNENNSAWNFPSNFTGRFVLKK